MRLREGRPLPLLLRVGGSSSGPWGDEEQLSTPPGARRTQLGFVLCCPMVWLNSFIARGQYDTVERILDLELGKLVFASSATWFICDLGKVISFFQVCFLIWKMEIKIVSSSNGSCKD